MRGYLARRRPQGHPQFRRRRLSGRMRTSRRAPDRAALSDGGRAAHRLSRLLSERLCASGDARRCARIPMSARCCWCRWAARNFAAAPCSRPLRPRAGRPKLLVIQDCGGTRAAIEEGRDWLEQALAATHCRGYRHRLFLRSRDRHQMRRLRRAQRHHDQSRRRPCLRHAGRCRRHLDVRGDLRTHRL